MSWKRNDWLPFSIYRSFNSKELDDMIDSLRRINFRKEIGLSCTIQDSRISKEISALDG